MDLAGAAMQAMVNNIHALSFLNCWFLAKGGGLEARSSGYGSGGGHGGGYGYQPQVWKLNLTNFQMIICIELIILDLKSLWIEATCFKKLKQRWILIFAIPFEHNILPF